MTVDRAARLVITCDDAFADGIVLNHPLAYWRRRVGALLKTLGKEWKQGTGLGALEVHLASAREMAVLNFRYLKHRGATDVLTFPMEEESAQRDGARVRKKARGRRVAVSGVVVVCPAVAKKEAAARRLPVEEELLRYILHGALHLLGEDDKTPAKRKRMHARQENILAAFNHSAAGR